MDKSGKLLNFKVLLLAGLLVIFGSGHAQIATVDDSAFESVLLDALESTESEEEKAQLLGIKQRIGSAEPIYDSSYYEKKEDITPSLDIEPVYGIYEYEGETAPEYTWDDIFTKPDAPVGQDVKVESTEPGASDYFNAFVFLALIAGLVGLFIRIAN